MVQHGDRGARTEKRIHFRRKPRAGRRMSVHYAVLDGEDRGPIESAHTLNIGVGGAFVITDDPPPAGTQLVLQLIIPAAGRTVELRGDVRWVADTEDDEVQGMGVRFHGLDEESHKLLNDYFTSLTATVDHDEAV